MRLLILKFHFCDLNSSWEMMVDKAVLELQMTYLAWLRSSWLSEMRSGGTSQAGENSFPFLFLFSFGEKSLFFFLFFYCENSFLFFVIFLSFFLSLVFFFYCENKFCFFFLFFYGENHHSYFYAWLYLFKWIHLLRILFHASSLGCSSSLSVGLSIIYWFDLQGLGKMTRRSER